MSAFTKTVLTYVADRLLRIKSDQALLDRFVNEEITLNFHILRVRKLTLNLTKPKTILLSCSP